MRLTTERLQQFSSSGKRVRAAHHPTVSQIAIDLMKEQAKVRANLWSYVEIASLAGVKVGLVEQIMSVMIRELRADIEREHRGAQEVDSNASVE